MFSQPTLLQKLKERPEIGSNSDDDEPEVVLPSLKEMIEVCRKLEGDCLLVCKEGALDYVARGCAPTPRPPAKDERK